MYCDRRECRRGIRRRSTHLFSQRSPGDVGQDEQDSVSCGSVKHNLKELLIPPPLLHVKTPAATAAAAAVAADEQAG